MQNKKTVILVEGAAMIALATILSMIRVYRLPWGGSITLFSMLPIVMFSIRRGVKNGLLVSAAYALVQFIQGVMDGLFGWGLNPKMLIACILLDYLLAYFVLGFAGIFRKGIAKKDTLGWIAGIALAIGIRFTCHLVSGSIIWHSFGELWNGFSTENSWLYSTVYNGCYMLPEMILTMIGTVALLKVPQTRKILLTEEMR